MHFAAGHAGVQELIKVLRESRLKIQHGKVPSSNVCACQAKLPSKRKACMLTVANFQVGVVRRQSRSSRHHEKQREAIS